MIPVDPPEAQRQSEISPDNIFVRYYVERARQLRREKRITPALWGWFCVMAERIGESGGAWASLRVIADDMGASPRCAQNAIRKLEKLGLIQCSFRNGRSTQYRFPSIFAYGNGGDHEITPDHKITPDHMIVGGGDHWIVGGGDPMIRGGVIIGSPISITIQDKPYEEEPTEAEQPASKPQEKEKTGRVYDDPREESRWQLQRRGVSLPIAAQIAIQYNTSEIDDAINALRKKELSGTPVKNASGYLIATLEAQTGRKIVKQTMEMVLEKTRMNR